MILALITVLKIFVGLKVCIYRARAIGGWIGYGLARTGASVCVMARGARLAALQHHGLRLTANGAVAAQAVACSATTAEQGVQHLVVLAVNAPSLPGVAHQMAPLIGPDPSFQQP